MRLGFRTVMAVVLSGFIITAPGCGGGAPSAPTQVTGSGGTLSSTSIVDPATITRCLMAGITVSVPTNSNPRIGFTNNCGQTVMIQWLWQLRDGQTGAAYSVVGPGHDNRIPTEIIGSSPTAQPIATSYGWFACPDRYGPVIPGTQTPVSFSTGSNYECRVNVQPRGSLLPNLD